MNWVRSTLTDESGRYDVAYVSLFFLMIAVLNTIIVMCTVSTWAYFRCRVFEVNGVIVNCLFDPQPLGIAVGAACGGFATALGGLAGYMLATRNAPRSTTTTTTKSTTEVAPPMPTLDAQQVPLQVDVVNLPDPPAAKKGKR